jgi:UPF0755 protein
LKKAAWTLGSVCALLAGVAALSVFVPYRGFQGETFVQLDRGAHSAAIARTLSQAGVIRYAWQFWILRVMNPTVRLQAGEYRFQRLATPGEVFGRIARGDVYYLEFTVPEGSNIFEIAQSLEAAGAMSAEDFLRAAADPSPIQDLDPQAKTLEGYLFPATYRLGHSTKAAELCKQMTDQFRRQWKKLAAAQTVDVHHMVTLASLVEKETGVPAERPLVAGVFTNRLHKGMLLECDPTTIYAALLEGRYRGAIRRSDLASPNAYNTYQNAGLPPGPIANPGSDTIAAALNPAETDYLYFVAKPSGGGHRFSANLAAHQKAVREYRRGSKNVQKTARKAG